MKRIIELAQEELLKEQDALKYLKTDKEFALNEALRLQGEIPVQEKKVEALDKALADLHKRYGYPECGTASSDMPQVSAPVKPMGKPAKRSNLDIDDLRNKIYKMGVAKGAEALAVAGVKRLIDLDEEDYEKVMSYLNS